MMAALAECPCVYVGTGEIIGGHNKLEFRLLHEGELLPSTNSKRRATEKHVIRRSFHPQLRRLWNISPNLKQLASKAWLETLDHPARHRFLTNQETVDPEGRFSEGLKQIGRTWARGGFNFIPLVTADMALRCSIDITLLRPEEERLIFKTGDIDGQLKTLFDALRMPSNVGESGGMGPKEDEDPFFCLLEDDRLISEVKVNTDTMLLLPNKREVRANDAHAIIHVKLNHRNARTFDNYFG